MTTKNNALKNVLILIWLADAIIQLVIGRTIESHIASLITIILLINIDEPKKL